MSMLHHIFLNIGLWQHLESKLLVLITNFSLDMLVVT